MYQCYSKKMQKIKNIRLTEIDDIHLPVKKNQKLGTIIVKEGNKVITEKDLIATENVDKLGYFKLIWNTLKKMITGNMN